MSCSVKRIDAEGGIFVLRAQDNMKYETVSTNFNVDTSTGLLEDHIIRLTGVKSQKPYPKELRLVRSCDMESGEVITFITNMTDTLELNELEIASIYRHRWNIELFFKLIKQNLNTKHMLGCSENAVKIHLWIAVIFYLLLTRIKAVYESPYLISKIATMVKVCASRKMELKALVI